MNRKPSALKILNGSAAHDPQRVNRTEPQPAVLDTVPQPPAWLTTVIEREEWAGLCADAILLGVLTVADLRTVAATAAAFAEYRNATENWHERDAAWKRYFNGLGRLGLNPTDRGRLHAAPKPKADPMTALLTPRRSTG